MNYVWQNKLQNSRPFSKRSAVMWNTYQSPPEGVAAGSPPNQDESGWWGGRCPWVTLSADYLSTPISIERGGTQEVYKSCLKTHIV